MARLETEALASRPELREQDYQTRISSAETRKAMLRMLPGLEFSAGGPLRQQLVSGQRQMG
ncbi:Outer membrane efflux protein [Pseudomonas meliae]|uniref:Outer membrane efflux protein n=1 Tax=Pseudomonas meliae TaxID=86176 RepID=A0A0P9VLG0_9PSED|nr:Outer membrane efflux protein [Pseudomonas meliae]